MPNYERPEFSPIAAKPIKGDALLRRKEDRRELVKQEDEQKDIARFRDKRCRYPHCPFCKRFKDLVPQAAHVVQAKGMSGDRTGERSTADKLMLLCPPIHARQERHEIDVVPLTPDGTWGPCEFWKEDPTTREKFLVARETAPFIYERD
jgi:hypothetical protein